MKKTIMLFVVICLLLVLGACQGKSQIAECRLEFLDDTRAFIQLIERDLANDKMDPTWLGRGREGGRYFQKYLSEELSDQEYNILNDLIQSFKFITFDDSREENLIKFYAKIEEIKKTINY
jgi:hypothetical protein